MKKKKKILSSVLCLAMLLSMSTTVFAVDTKTVDTNTATSTADLVTEGLVFNLEVPTSLPVSVDSAGNIEVSTDCVITNNSGGMVKVTNISLDTTDSGWEIVGYETDFTQEKVGLKQFGITINEDEVATDGSLSLGTNWVALAANGGELAIDYAVNVASQSTALDLSIATVEFTLDWNAVVDGYTDWVVEKYDFSGDGVVDVDDSTLIYNHVAYVTRQTDEVILAKMDINGDDDINITDATILNLMIAGTKDWV